MNEEMPQTHKMTREESLDWVVEHGVHFGAGNGTLVTVKGPNPERFPDGILGLYFWRLNPSEEEIAKAKKEWIQQHAGRLFLQFGLSKEASMVLLLQLAGALGMTVVSTPENELRLAT